MLRGKIFERNEEIGIGGQICPLPVCLGLRLVPVPKWASDNLHAGMYTARM